MDWRKIFLDEEGKIDRLWWVLFWVICVPTMIAILN